MIRHPETIKVYDKSAKHYAKLFRGIGSRVADIERALELAGQNDGSAKAVEIGCGDGRDASAIIKRVSWYEGFDPSKGFLALAKKLLPGASLVQADALSYNYPQNIDVCFAFASLLHVDRHDFAKVAKLVNKALRPGGIFYISLKERPEYAEELYEDDRGSRMYYYYTATDVKKLVGDLFEIVYEDHHRRGSTDWFVMALKNK